VNIAHIDLVGLSEISYRAGVGVDEVAVWATNPDFPDPEVQLGIGAVWVWGPVHHWLREHHHRADVDLTLF